LLLHLFDEGPVGTRSRIVFDLRKEHRFHEPLTSTGCDIMPIKKLRPRSLGESACTQQ
jgi:hypothetical protein